MHSRLRCRPEILPGLVSRVENPDGRLRIRPRDGQACTPCTCPRGSATRQEALPLKRSGSMAPCVLVLAVLPLVGGCLTLGGAPAGVQIWAMPDSAMVLPDAVPELENEVYSDAGHSIRAASAIDEIVSLQIALRGGKNPVSIQDFSVSDLREAARSSRPRGCGCIAKCACR